MIITLCFLYSIVCVISFLGFLFISLEVHEILFWIYEVIPFGLSLIPRMRPFISFFVEWVKFMWNICETFLYVILHLFSYIFALFSIGTPFLSKVGRVLCSFSKWMCSELWRGIYMTGHPILTAFSWMMVMCTCLLCFDRIFQVRTLNNQENFRIRHNGLQRNREENADENDQENENAENRLIEIRRRLINRQANHTNDGPGNNINDTRLADQQAVNRPEINDSRGDNLDRYEIDRQLCIICIENVRNFAVFPCGHLHFCRMCVENLFRSRNNVKCPVCNIHIQEYRRIYV